MPSGSVMNSSIAVLIFCVNSHGIMPISWLRPSASVFDEVTKSPIRPPSVSANIGPMPAIFIAFTAGISPGRT